MAVLPVSGVKTAFCSLLDWSEFRDCGQDLVSQRFDLGCFVEPEDGSIVGADQGAWKQEEFVAQGSQSEALPILGQTDPLKSGDPVIGKANDLEIEAVGRKRAGGDVGQGKIFAQFANADFHGGSTVVETPEAMGGRSKFVTQPR